MNKLLARTIAAVALAAGLAAPAAAHRQWMLPSATNFSGEDNWLTVDAAVSNDLFYFEHRPGNIDNVKAIAPDGTTEVPLENKGKGQYRNTFDVHLAQKGTYRIGSASDMLMGSYVLDGKTERLPRGTTKETLAGVLPAGATDVKTSESISRNELYVTVGEPTTTVFKPTGRGIELMPVTHPNDLVSGETATFQFLLDGKPTANLKVTVIPGGIRYRDQLGQMDLVTGADGKVAITWPAPGMYWVNVSTGADRPEGGPGGPGAGNAGAPGIPPAGAPAPDGPPPRRATYVTTLEVMAP